eukprot:345650-Chlamydomonas_euryale.AAC.5
MAARPAAGPKRAATVSASASASLPSGLALAPAATRRYVRKALVHLGSSTPQQFSSFLGHRMMLPECFVRRGACARERGTAAETAAARSAPSAEHAHRHGHPLQSASLPVRGVCAHGRVPGVRAHARASGAIPCAGVEDGKCCGRCSLTLSQRSRMCTWCWCINLEPASCMARHCNRPGKRRARCAVPHDARPSLTRSCHMPATSARSQAVGGAEAGALGHAQSISLTLPLLVRLRLPARRNRPGCGCGGREGEGSGQRSGLARRSHHLEDLCATRSGGGDDAGGGGFPGGAVHQFANTWSSAAPRSACMVATLSRPALSSSMHGDHLVSSSPLFQAAWQPPRLIQPSLPACMATALFHPAARLACMACALREAADITWLILGAFVRDAAVVAKDAAAAVEDAAAVVKGAVAPSTNTRARERMCGVGVGSGSGQVQVNTST